MAKTIKFNLICDNNPVRTLEDLKNNFSIEDMLEYYENNLLHRWLKVRGYKNELEKVSEIKVTEKEKIAKELVKIFDINIKDEEIDKEIYILEYLKYKEEKYLEYIKNKKTVEDIIKEYEIHYESLIRNIIENPEDIAMIKANIKEIVENYEWIVKLDHRRLFYTLRDKSKLAVICLLMDTTLRRYYLPDENDENNENDEIDEENNQIKYDEEIYRYIKQSYTSSELKEVLGDNLKSFSGDTDGYWKDIEEKGKRYMILSINVGDYVREAGKKDGDLSFEKVNNKFVILDGIDYKSKSAKNSLLYMEV